MLNKRKRDLIVDMSLGAFKGTRYKVHRALCRGIKPAQLEIKITPQCNSRCIMCKIWQNKGKQEFSFQELEEIIGADILSGVKKIVISGGEPFLRGDLGNILEMMMKRLVNLREISIKTNGFLTEIIMNTVKHIFKNKVDKKLILIVSFDGIGKDHDKTRKVPNAYDKAMATVKKLQFVSDERLEVQANVAIGPYNIEKLKKIDQNLTKSVSKISWFPVIVSSRNFSNQEKQDVLLFREDQKKKLIDFFKYLSHLERSGIGSYYYTRMIETLNRGYRTFPCTGGYTYMHIDFDGNIGPCPFVNKELTFGNIRNNSLTKIWTSDFSRKKRIELKRNEGCRSCTSIVDLYSLVREEYFNFASYLLARPVKATHFTNRYLKHYHAKSDPVMDRNI